MSEPNDWIEWAGGDCPVESETIVETRLADGSTWFTGPNVSAAKYWDWDGEQHRPTKHIIAYRVVKP